MRVIQGGDTVFIQKTVDIQWYESGELGWKPLRVEHLGESGSVICRSRTRDGNWVVYVQPFDKRLYSGEVFWWRVRDVSLFPLSKWRRQDLGGGR